MIFANSSFEVQLLVERLFFSFSPPPGPEESVFLSRAACVRMCLCVVYSCLHSSQWVISAQQDQPLRFRHFEGL